MDTIAWLRRASDRYFAAWGADNENGRRYKEAADEIESLRGQVKILKQALQKELHPPRFDNPRKRFTV